MVKLSQAYLFCYNAAQAVGWMACLVSIVRELAAGSPPAQIYESAGGFARVFQFASALEILHAATGLVPSSAANALMQWAGRSNVLFPIFHALPELHSSWWGVVLLSCWSLAEVVRYPWYAFSILDAAPGWLTWLRYTAFIPLYPLGVVAEMSLIFTALPTLRKQQLYSLRLPNRWNVAFSYTLFLQTMPVVFVHLLQALLLAYPFLWWQLYSTLLRQRTKRLRPAAHVKTA